MALTCSDGDCRGEFELAGAYAPAFTSPLQLQAIKILGRIDGDRQIHIKRPVGVELVGGDKRPVDQVGGLEQVIIRSRRAVAARQTEVATRQGEIPKAGRGREGHDQCHHTGGVGIETVAVIKSAGQARQDQVTQIQGTTISE